MVAAESKRRRRLVSPARENVAASVFEHPVFADFAAYRDLLFGAAWPDLDMLNARMESAAPCSPSQRFVAQTPALLADELHYETRIAEHGQIATREGNWHDLLNALVWMRWPQLKQALNTRQTSDIARVGPRERTRGQCALTLFDEGGLIVVLRDARLIEAWDRHDWPLLFGTHADDWRNAARVFVFGHALLEHALEAGRLLVGKAILVDAASVPSDAEDERRVMESLAAAIVAGTVLTDPQELRPLPVNGLPGWSEATRSDAMTRDAFLRTAECFQAKAAGRSYPPPIQLPEVPVQPRRAVQSAGQVAEAGVHG